MQTQPKLRVCVVDGDAAVRDSLATLLDLSGHEVVTHACAQPILDALEGGGELLLDCVICETDLPGASGLELLRALKAHRPSSRVALLLSHKDPALEIAARQAGADAVFAKPLLNRTLKRFVEGSRSEPRFGNYG